ncbi:MAG TPA: hypothetical protein VK574_01690 [Terracidiphilus sp.]|jgi:uncharacterized membrane protein YhaH (DUF805 family)|nr:hypothetical protein [Terracidiphilus sp.]
MSANGISSIVDLVLILCILAALIATVRMCAKDAIRRGKSPWLVTLMVIGFFPFGLLVWLVFRPKIIEPAASGEKFRLDNFRVR